MYIKVYLNLLSLIHCQFRPASQYLARLVRSFVFFLFELVCRASGRRRESGRLCWVGVGSRRPKAASLRAAGGQAAQTLLATTSVS